MKNVEESIWGIAMRDTIMMSKENWEWKQKALWEYVTKSFFSLDIFLTFNFWNSLKFTKHKL